jgi:cell wall-associated NlpC family hydrolase
MKIRARLAAAPVVLLLAALVGFVPTGPAVADPDIEDVRAKVDKLYHEAEQAAERHNDARLELEGLQDELESLQADEERQEDRLGKARDSVRDAVISQQYSQPLQGVAELLDSDTDSFLEKLSTVSTVNSIQEALLAEYNNQLESYAIRREETEKRRKRISAVTERAAEEMDTAESKLAEARQLLSRLEASQRRAVLSRDAGTTTAPAAGELPPPSGNAQAAVQFALAQVGKTYSYGAAGPNSFDCSGLTMRAWQAAGVSLPHSSRAQYGVGRKVAFNQLQPGDLVFYYSPISHVGIYVGNGMIVHAANPRTGVQMAPVRSMPYVGAVRPG